MTTAEHAGFYSNKQVLVTGGAGAIGSNLCLGLLDLGAKVTILDDLSASQQWTIPEHSNVDFIKGSVVDENAIEQAFSKTPDVVFHLAALFANQNSIDHPEDDLMVNGLGTLKVLERSRSGGVKRVVYASSGCSVYGREAPFPLVEDFISDDLDTPYQITKFLGELYANFFRNFYDLEVVRARFFNSYGPGEVPGNYRNVIPNFMYWALNQQPLPITGSGDETRDWTFVGDIMNGLLLCGRVPEAAGEAFNLASGRETRVADLATMINELTENPAGVNFIDRRDWDMHGRRLASVQKAGEVLGYEPVTDFREGLKTTMDWFRDNWSKIDKTARF